ncbi:hypothetical protein V5N11_032759 [Cardamine amara subsp. amara]|uniref:Reverse transcriptase zinc-binding domain-containing protein n=1 Tax=Cardamine amara subsp. amara TaxID=228776 RepID=A0ABD1AM11_CARAN
MALRFYAWKLKTLRKIRHFMLQVLSGCIAKKQNLLNRRVGQDGLCPRCGAENETTNHMLFLCPFARQIWDTVPTGLDPSLFPSEALFTHLDTLFWRLNEEALMQDQVRSFPWILWLIWKARNEKVFNGIRKSLDETLNMAVTDCRAWGEANNKEANTVPPSTEPENGQDLVPSNRSSSLICKTDAAWKESDHYCGLGWCIFNELEEPVFVGIQGTRRSLSATHTELQGLVWAMQCLEDMNHLCYTFQTDCKDLIAITENLVDWPVYHAELADFSTLKKKFPLFKLCFIPRGSNVHADFFLHTVREFRFIFSHL